MYFSDLASCISRLPLPWCVCAPCLEGGLKSWWVSFKPGSNRALRCLSGFARSPSFCQWRIILSRCPGVAPPTHLLNNTMQCALKLGQYQSSQNDTAAIHSPARPNSRLCIASAPLFSGTAYDFVEKLIFSPKNR